MSKENDRNFDEAVTKALWEFYNTEFKIHGAWGKKEQKQVLKLIKACRANLRESSTNFNRYNFLTEIILTFDVEKHCDIYDWNTDYVLNFLGTLSLIIEKYY